MEPKRNQTVTQPTWTVFAALGDPIRQAIIRQLAPGPLTAGRIAATFRVTRPAISRHLRVLREAGCVIEQRDGRHRVYRLARPALGAALDWLSGLARPGTPRAVERTTVPSGRGDDWAPWSG